MTGDLYLMNYFVALLFFLVITAVKAQDNSRTLLSGQPVLSQMTGNCYTHSGTDVLTGIFLRENTQESVDQPHPLLLGGVVSANVGRSNISSGLTCDFFNEAKKYRQPMCSVRGFNQFVSHSGMSVQSVKDNINLLDRSMQNLFNLIKKDTLSLSEQRQAREHANNIIGATCTLNGLVDLNDDTILKLVDEAREVISKLSAVRGPNVGTTILNMLTLGPAAILLRSTGGSVLYSMSGRRAMNRVLDNTYSKLNSECVKYSAMKNIPSVGKNFFTASNRFTCHDQIYKNPMLSGNALKEKFEFIDRQVRAGYPTGIFVCAGIFYAKFPKLSGYRKANGDCVNGGGHAVTVTGVEYRNGKRFFKIRNSWGAGSCSTLTRGQNICREQAAINNDTGCPTEKSITCSGGNYYLSEDYLGKGLWGHTRLTVPRRR